MSKKVRNRTAACMAVLMGFWAGANTASGLTYDDGDTHVVSTLIAEYLYVGVSTSTTVNLVSGGTVYGSAVGPDSYLNVWGGTVQGTVTLNQGHLEVTDGVITGDIATNEGIAHISGGTLQGDLTALMEGYPGTDGFYVYGGGFRINGTPVAYGTYTYLDYASGQLTGTLAAGDPLDVNFTLLEYQPLVLVVPEPVSLLLLGMGGAWWLKRRASRRRQG